MAMMVGNLAGNGNPSAAQSPQAVYLIVEATRRPRRQQHHRRVQGSGRRHAQRPAVDHGDRRHVAHPRSGGHGRQRRHHRDRDPGQGHRRQPGHRRHRRAEHHGRPAGRGDQRRSGRERAGRRHALRRQRGRGHRPGDRGAHVPGRGRHDQRPELLVQPKVRLSDYQRGGTVYWAGSFTATPPTLVRTDARHVGRARSSRRSTGSARTAPTTRSASTCTASSTRVSGSPTSRAWRPPSGWSATTRRTRRPRSTSTSSTSSSCRSSNPDGGHAAFHDNSVQRKNLTNYCPMTGNTGYVNQPQLVGRRPQPQQHGRHALRRLRRRGHGLHG